MLHTLNDSINIIRQQLSIQDTEALRQKIQNLANKRQTLVRFMQSVLKKIKLHKKDIAEKQEEYLRQCIAEIKAFLAAIVVEQAQEDFLQLIIDFQLSLKTQIDLHKENVLIIEQFESTTNQLSETCAAILDDNSGIKQSIDAWIEDATALSLSDTSEELQTIHQDMLKTMKLYQQDLAANDEHWKFISSTLEKPILKKLEQIKNYELQCIDELQDKFSATAVFAKYCNSDLTRELYELDSFIQDLTKEKHELLDAEQIVTRNKTAIPKQTSTLHAIKEKTTDINGFVAKAKQLQQEMLDIAQQIAEHTKAYDAAFKTKDIETCKIHSQAIKKLREKNHVITVSFEQMRQQSASLKATCDHIEDDVMEAQATANKQKEQEELAIHAEITHFDYRTNLVFPPKDMQEHPPQVGLAQGTDSSPGPRPELTLLRKLDKDCGVNDAATQQEPVRVEPAHAVAQKPDKPTDNIDPKL